MSQSDYREYDDLAPLMRGRQPVRTAILENILGNHGFELKSIRGSHLKYTNDEFALTVVIIQNSTEVTYQRRVVEVCSKVRTLIRDAREKELRRNKAEASNPPDAAIRTQDALPDVFECSAVPEHPDSVVVRWKKFPQVGTLAGAQTTRAEFDVMLKSLLRETVAFEDALAEAQKRLNLEVNFSQDRQLFILQPDYKLFMWLKPFDADTVYNATQQAIAFARFCDQKDDELAKPVEEAVKRAAARGAAKGEVLDDGSIDWTLKRRSAISGLERTLKFRTSSAYRLNEETSSRLLDELFQADYTDPNDNKFLSKTLHEKWGFEVHRPREGNKLGTKLRGSHPFYPDCTFEIPVPDDIPLIAPLTRRALQTADREERAKLEYQILLSRLQRKIVDDILDDAMALIILEQGDTEDRREAGMKRLQEIGFSTQKLKKAPKLGEPYDVRMLHPDIPLVVELRCMDLVTVGKNPGEDQEISISHPADVQRLEATIKVIEGMAEEVGRKARQRLTPAPQFNPLLRQ